MKKTLLFALLALVQFQAFSQIKMRSERDKDGNVILYAENTDLIHHTLTIEFKDLSNLIPSGGMKTFAVAGPGVTQVARLKKENTNQSFDNYNYSYTYIRGNYRAKSKTGAIYLPPVSPGTLVSAMPMTHIENTIKNEKVNEDYVGISFRFDDPTTICAPRKGMVVDIRMDENKNTKNLGFDSNENFIEIYNEDGTFSKIMVLKAGSAKVNLGDWVYPGDPIAESAGEQYVTGRHVRMVQSRLVKNEDSIQREFYPITLHVPGNGNIQVTEATEILVEHPEALVQQEMSKREKKKFASR